MNDLRQKEATGGKTPKKRNDRKKMAFWEEE